MKSIILAASLFIISSVTQAAVSSFELPWMNAATAGTKFNSADYKDGVFVVEAYFLNCPYCNDNAENVNDLADSYANEPRVKVLDVGIDQSDAQYAEWIRRHRPNHPVLKDAQRMLIKQLGTTGYPSTYVIDCKGNVVLKSSGVFSATKKSQIKQEIDHLLAQDNCN